MNTSNSVFGRCRREDEAEAAVFLKAAFLLLIFSGVVCSQEFRANLTAASRIPRARLCRPLRFKSRTPAQTRLPPARLTRRAATQLLCCGRASTL